MKLPLSTLFQGNTVYHRTDAPDDLLQKVIDQHRRHHKNFSLTQQLVLGIAGPLIVLLIIWVVGMGGYKVIEDSFQSQHSIVPIASSGDILSGTVATGSVASGNETTTLPTPLETEIFDAIEDIFTNKGAVTSGTIR